MIKAIFNVVVGFIVIFFSFSLCADNPQASSIFRSYDGSYNNIADIGRGAAGTAPTRQTPYRNWSNIGYPLPNPRLASFTEFGSYFAVNSPGSSNLLFQATLELLMIDMVDLEKESNFSYVSVPQCDSVFDANCFGNATIRYAKNRVLNYTNEGVPIYNNLASHYIDCSFLYGLSTSAAKGVRTLQNGMLYSDNRGYPQIIDYTVGMEDDFYIGNGKSRQLFKFADMRVNRNICTQVLGVLLLREHNRQAALLLKSNPDWSDETYS